MAIGDIYQARFVGTYESQQVNVVLHFKAKTGVSTPQGLANALAASTQWKDLLVTGLSNQLQYSEVQVQSLYPYGAATVAAALTSWVGGSAAVRMPGECCWVITKRSASIGRSHRGRMYLCGAPQSQCTGGLWLAGFITGVQTSANAVFAIWGFGGSSADYELGIWSRAIAGATPPFNPSAYSSCTSLFVRSEVRSQRRRQIGVGA